MLEDVRDGQYKLTPAVSSVILHKLVEIVLQNENDRLDLGRRSNSPSAGRAPFIRVFQALISDSSCFLNVGAVFAS